MKKRRNIYVGPELARLIAERAGEETVHRSISSVINAIADRYIETVRRHTPRLQVGEWLLIFDALDVWSADNAALATQGLPHGVADAITLDGADGKWGIDGPALVKKLEKMDWCQRLAVIDAAERFWARDDWPADHRETVAAVVGAGSIDSTC